MNWFKNLLVVCALTLLTTGQTHAQCCSPGNPVSGSGNVGIVEKNNLRTITFYRNSFSNTYYRNSEVADALHQGTVAKYRYVGEILSYGLLKRLTIEAELGYFIQKVKTDKFFGDLKGYGISTAVFGTKYCALKTISNWEITLGAGLKVPFSKKVFRNDMGPLPPDLQPSTGAFGVVGQLFIAKTLPDIGMKFILLNRYEHNGRNDIKYHFGDTYFSSFFVSKHFMKHFNGMLQIRNEYRTKDDDDNTLINNTGGELIFISPQLSYTFPPNWAISALVDLPAYRNYNDMQLGPKYAFSLTVTKTFKLK